MKKRINLLYWLAIFVFVSLCFVAWQNRFAWWIQIFSLLSPIIVALWAAYLIVIADNIVKPNKDFPLILVIIFHGIVAIGFFIFWQQINTMQNNWGYFLSYAVAGLITEALNIFRTNAQKKGMGNEK